MEKISDILDITKYGKDAKFNDIYQKGCLISISNVDCLNKKEKIIGMCIFVNSNYLILVYNYNKLKVFSKEGNYKVSGLDMTLLNLYRLYGYKLDGYIYTL